MYYTGLITRYPTGVHPSDEDHRMRLSGEKTAGLEPTSELSVTRINSTYLEIVDKYYGWRGGISGLFLPMLAVVIAAAAMAIYEIFYVGWDDVVSRGEEAGVILAASGLVLVGSAVSALLIWGLSKELFKYTHYPIRINRKNRMVYVFRLNGTVLAVRWDELFFTMGSATPDRTFGTDWDLRAHVLEEDGKTIRETFAFSPVGDAVTVKCFYEYLRRYMDEGPQAVQPYTNFCLQISDRKEHPLFGFRKLWLSLNGWLTFQILLLPLFVVAAIGRYLVMTINKMPRWPVEVEAECRIEPNDPYVRDGNTHPAQWNS